MRVCAEPGCPVLLPAAGRCPQHRREVERRRGTRQARGYGAEHDRLRAEWKPKVERGIVRCWRCRVFIDAGQPWDLGHDDKDRTVWRGPEHQDCNRGAAGRASHAR